MDSIYKKKPLFVGRKVEKESAVKLRKFAHELGLTSALPVEDMHMTVVFSKTEVNWHDLEADNKKIIVTLSHLEMLGQNKDVLALNIKDYPYLNRRNKYYLDNGATSDWPDYKPHITLSWKASGLNVDLTKKFNDQIILEAEYFDDIIDTGGYEPVEKDLEEKPADLDEETWKYMSKEGKRLFIT